MKYTIQFKAIGQFIQFNYAFNENIKAAIICIFTGTMHQRQSWKTELDSKWIPALLIQFIVIGLLWSQAAATVPAPWQRNVAGVAGEHSIAFSRECSCVVQVFGGFVDECSKGGVDVPLWWKQSQVLSCWYTGFCFHVWPSTVCSDWKNRIRNTSGRNYFPLKAVWAQSYRSVSSVILSELRVEPPFLQTSKEKGKEHAEVFWLASLLDTS